MKVGLDHLPLLGHFKWDIVEFMGHAADYGYEGVQIPTGPLVEDVDLRRRVADIARERDLYVEIGGAGIDAARARKTPAELAAGWPPLFEVAREVGARVLITGIGTWPWEGRTSDEPGQSAADQIDGGAATLREVGPMAADHDMQVSVHTAFHTAAEYVRLMEEADSPNVGLCLDTANAYLVLEDPTEFANAVAPWVNATHFKDSAVYLTGDGMDWLGGSELGCGAVDLTRIVRILHDANPDMDLTVEDHWGRSNVPVYDAEFLASLPAATGEARASFLRQLRAGAAALESGSVPTRKAVAEWDLSATLPDRARRNAEYAKGLRDAL